MNLNGIEQEWIERRLAEIERAVGHISHQNHQIEHQAKQIEETQRQILHILRHPHPPTTLSRVAAVQFQGETITMQTNNLTLAVGQTSTATPVTFLADGITLAGATLSNVSYAYSDPSATVAINPDGLTALVTGVAASTGPISGAVSFTATDTDGAVSQWQQAFTITVSAPPPPGQLSQSAAVQFSDPV